LRSDKLIVTKLDRIARTAITGFETVKGLLDRGVSVHVLNMGLIDNTPTGRLILHIMLSFAEFEREMIKERTAAGKAIARQKPGYKEGRPKQITPEILNLPHLRKALKWGILANWAYLYISHEALTDSGFPYLASYPGSSCRS
jgi:DNA invertase Pin-like site-specific DNA recombinase